MSDGPTDAAHDTSRPSRWAPKWLPPGGQRRAWLGRLALSFVVGSIGAALFVYMRWPLPYFLGALTACLIVSVANAPVERPRMLSVPMRTVLGVAVGSAFTPVLLDRIAGMVSSLVFLIPYMLAIIWFGLVFYQRVAKFDKPTAFFSAVPGGLTDMVSMAADAGANGRTVTLVQATRILFIVFLLPFWIEWHGGIDVGSAVASRVRLAEVAPLDGLIMIAMAFGGWWTAKRLGLAGAPIVGPMIVSGLAHTLGWTTAKVPMEVLTIAQVTVGINLGCQFRGITWKEFSTTMIWGIVFAVILVVFTALLALVVSYLTGFNEISVLLAFAPGGQTELNLLTYVLGLDVAYVALHHLFRLAIVILGAQIIFATTKDWKKPDG